jgi:hypothetical protein
MDVQEIIFPIDLQQSQNDKLVGSRKGVDRRYHLRNVSRSTIAPQALNEKLRKTSLTVCIVSLGLPLMSQPNQATQNVPATLRRKMMDWYRTGREYVGVTRLMERPWAYGCGKPMRVRSKVLRLSVLFLPAQRWAGGMNTRCKERYGLSKDVSSSGACPIMPLSRMPLLFFAHHLSDITGAILNFTESIEVPELKIR